ncbi:MAG TPA: aldo/keto reductase [Bacteroidales bacterium]|nr:aldo/keto reductase [Bacteroidales bacterium]
MKYRYLGNSGLKVSELCYGAMTFTGDKHSNTASTGQQEANHLAAAALDLGINFFDTADVYANGTSEMMLGKALGQRRKDVVVATKVRFAMSSKPNDTGLSRHHIIESCEASLHRLNTDYIDLYQVHSYDPGTPLDEMLRALDDLVRTGKVRYIGCSNLTAWQTMKALAVSERLNLEKFITTQLYYSIGARDIEQELIPLCLDQKLGILCWSPLSGGFFTGKYRHGDDVPLGMRRSDPQASNMKYWPVDEDKGFEIVSLLEKIGTNYQKTIAQTALNWLLHKAAVSSVIIGARNLAQLKENAGATGWILQEEDIKLLDEISAQPLRYPMWHQKYSDER